MRIEDWNAVHDMVVHATGELFDSVSLPVAYVGPVSHRSARWAESLAIIGLTGHLRGSLIPSIPTDLLVQCHPAHS